MTEHAEAVATSSSDASEQRAAEQARLRKERREAKIKAGGADRLNKITGIGGRVVGETEQATPVVPTDAPAPSPAKAPAQVHADPDEIDISQLKYEARPSSSSSPLPPAGSGIPEAQLRQMMLGLEQQRGSGGPRPPPPSADDDDNDPMMKMMAQIMGGGAGGGGNASAFPGMMRGMPGPQPPRAPPSPYNTIWRLVHALIALTLGLYLTLFTDFSGTKLQRARAAVAHEQQHLGAAADAENERHKRVFFWLFATAEAVLLTTRLLLDKGRAPPEGFVWTAVGFVPAPLRGYLVVALKYGQLFSTVRTDILTCMFVLGVCSWLRG